MRKLRILYVSVTGRGSRPYADPSTRYRCFYPVEALRSLGHSAWVLPHERVNDIDPSNFDAIVIHRPVFLPDMVNFIEKARASGVHLTADYDDLIFNPRFARQSSIYKSSFNLNNAVTIFKRNTDALKMFNTFTTSTLNLASRVEELVPDAKIMHMPNCIPRSLREFVGARVFSSKINREYIGYFPGTKTHDIDFKECESSLIKFCSENSVPLMIVGPLEVGSVGDQKVNIIRREPVPFEDMFKLLSECKVVIAPLEDSLFNDAKSHIKLLEGSLACCSVVYSNIPDMKQHNDFAPYYVNKGTEWLPAFEDSWKHTDNARNQNLADYFFEKFDSVAYSRYFIDQIAVQKGN